METLETFFKGLLKNAPKIVAIATLAAMLVYTLLLLVLPVTFFGMTVPFKVPENAVINPHAGRAIALTFGFLATALFLRFVIRWKWFEGKILAFGGVVAVFVAWQIFMWFLTTAEPRKKLSDLQEQIQAQQATIAQCGAKVTKLRTRVAAQPARPAPEVQSTPVQFASIQPAVYGPAPAPAPAPPPPPPLPKKKAQVVVLDAEYQLYPRSMIFEIMEKNGVNVVFGSYTISIWRRDSHSVTPEQIKREKPLVVFQRGTNNWGVQGGAPPIQKEFDLSYYGNWLWLYDWVEMEFYGIDTSGNPQKILVAAGSRR